MGKTILLYTNSDNGTTDKNFEYLLGFQPSLGGIVLTGDEVIIFLDPRYFSKTNDIDEDTIKNRLGQKDIKISYVEVKASFVDVIGEKLVGIGEVAVHEVVSIDFYNKLQEALGSTCEVGSCEDPLVLKRLVKDAGEVQNMNNAIEIIDRVCEYIYQLNDDGRLIGMTELQVRGIIISKIFEYGGSGESFESVVAFGENSACPHHYAGETVISEGVLLIDMGALYKGYCSDFTRTFWVKLPTGRVTEELKEQKQKFEEIHEIVKKAHEMAFVESRVGMNASQIDIFARNVISEAGYGEFFIHATGHGIGLDVHEKPHVTKKSEEVIVDSSFFTIEPGIYLPGEFGIRLEDIVYMKDGKPYKYTKCIL